LSKLIRRKPASKAKAARYASVQVLPLAGAIAVYRELASDERVSFAPEPPGID
jgi:hypothetical protein